MNYCKGFQNLSDKLAEIAESNESNNSELLAALEADIAKDDLLSYDAVTGNYFTVTGIVSLTAIANSGEFSIENTNNDLSVVIDTTGGGTVGNVIYISSDGTSTTNANFTSVPTGWESDKINTTETYKVTCLKDGNLSLNIKQ